MLEFVESKVFTRKLFTIAGDRAEDVLLAIQSDLLRNPIRGSVVRGLGGIRKAKTSDPARNKGKRGGLRYLYIYFLRDEQIGLLYLFGKNEQEDLTEDEKGILAELAKEGE